MKFQVNSTFYNFVILSVSIAILLALVRIQKFKKYHKKHGNLMKIHVVLEKKGECFATLCPELTRAVIQVAIHRLYGAKHSPSSLPLGWPSAGFGTSRASA